MGKVKRISLNGVPLDIDDENALQLPDVEPRDGDILVYSSEAFDGEGGFEYQPKPANITVDSELNANSENPVQNKAIVAGVEKKKQIVEVYANYNSVNNSLSFFAIIDGNRVDGSCDPFTIGFMCFGTAYDQSDNLSISNLSGVFNISIQNGQVSQNTPNFGNFSNERNVNLFVSDPITSNRIVLLRTPVVSIPATGVTTNLITVTSQNGSNYTSDIILTPTNVITESIKVRLTIIEPGFEDKIIDRTLETSQLNYTINVGKSCQDRQVLVQIIENSNVSPCVLNTSVVRLTGRLESIILNFDGNVVTYEYDGIRYVAVGGTIGGHGWIESNELFEFSSNLGDIDNPSDPVDIEVDGEEADVHPGQDGYGFYFWSTEDDAQFVVILRVLADFTYVFSYTEDCKGDRRQLIFNEPNYSISLD